MSWWAHLFAPHRIDRAIGVAVLTRAGTRVDVDALVRRLRARHVEVARDERFPAEVLLMADDQRVSIARARPPPSKQLAELASTAWWWPEANAVCNGLLGSIAVEIEAGEGSRHQRRRLASEVALAIAHAVEAPAILWRDADALYSRAMFEEHLDAHRVPTRAWISVRVAERDGVRFFYTTGLDAFGQREIEMNIPTPGAMEHAWIVREIARHLTSDHALMPIGKMVFQGKTLKVAVEAARIAGRRDVFRLRG